MKTYVPASYKPWWEPRTHLHPRLGTSTYVLATSVWGVPAYTLQIGRYLHGYVPLLCSCNGCLLQCRMANLSGHVSAFHLPPAHIVYTEKFATGANWSIKFFVLKICMQHREHQHHHGLRRTFLDRFVSGDISVTKLRNTNMKSRRLFIDVVAFR